MKSIHWITEVKHLFYFLPLQYVGETSRPVRTCVLSTEGRSHMYPDIFIRLVFCCQFKKPVNRVDRKQRLTTQTHYIMLVLFHWSFYNICSSTSTLLRVLTLSGWSSLIFSYWMTLCLAHGDLLVLVILLYIFHGMVLMLADSLIAFVLYELASFLEFFSL